MNNQDRPDLLRVKISIGFFKTTRNREARELKGSKVASLGRGWVRFVLHKNWPFDLQEIFIYPMKQPTLVGTNSAQMPFLP